MPKIFDTLDRIKPIYDITDKVVMFICKILLIADILITSYAVLGRYCQQLSKSFDWAKFLSIITDPAWTEEIVLTLMSYMAVLSAALAIIMLVVGWQYATTLGSRGTYVSLPKLSRFWMYFPVPIAGIAMIVFELEAIYNHIKAFFVKEEVAK